MSAVAPKFQPSLPASRPRPDFKPGLGFLAICRLAIDNFRLYKIRFGLTALSMMIGTASLIVVVTIGLTGKRYVLNQIQGIGANMIEAYHQGGGAQAVRGDYITHADVAAVRRQVPGIRFASPMTVVHTPISVGDGKQREVELLGVEPDYEQIRKLDILAGRFFDQLDSQDRNKTAVIAEKLAVRLYGNPQAAIGAQLKLVSLPFTVVGVFREGVETFGQTEISDNSILIPDTVARYFTVDDIVRNVFFSMADPKDVARASLQVQKVLQSRHRPGANYQVVNLNAILSIAGKVANALTLVLSLVSAITLVVGGVGIMNIMLATVNARVREIGVRKAVGATKREIHLQFLTEAALISLVGCGMGIVVGLIIPFSLRWLAGIELPVPGVAAVVAIAVCAGIGLLCGTGPAARAANLDAVECLHQEA
jgi:putative ABC transport system permease protein